MINTYYQQELSHLKELAVEFSKAHRPWLPCSAVPPPTPMWSVCWKAPLFFPG